MYSIIEPEHGEYLGDFPTPEDAEAELARLRTRIGSRADSWVTVELDSEGFPVGDPVEVRVPAEA